MALNSEVESGVRRTLQTQLQVRDGRRVPDKRDLSFLNSGGAVRLDATYAYADLANSSGLAQRMRQEVAANVIRAYVHAGAKTFNSYGGEIRSFDGDRVMAIFIGPDKNVLAVRAALALSWAVEEVINPIMRETWSDISQHWTMKHGVGIATGESLIVRGGVFGDSDIISVGGAPNIAAKLSGMRPSAFGPQYSTHITEEVYQDLPDELRLTEGKTWPGPYFSALTQPTSSFVDMWDPLGALVIGGATVMVRGSTYRWEP